MNIYQWFQTRKKTNTSHHKTVYRGTYSFFFFIFGMEKTKHIYQDTTHKEIVKSTNFETKSEGKGDLIRISSWSRLLLSEEIRKDLYTKKSPSVPRKS